MRGIAIRDVSSADRFWAADALGSVHVSATPRAVRGELIRSRYLPTRQTGLTFDEDVSVHVMCQASRGDHGERSSDYVVAAGRLRH
jgi:hypothetical protein